jgi:hypothetical protein
MCFRYPMLLRRHRITHILNADRHGRVKEYYCDIFRRPAAYHRREYLPERQPPRSQPSLPAGALISRPNFGAL